MEIIKQVCSPEHAKRLKELGVIQESLFSWFDTERYGLTIEESNTSFDLDHYLSVQRLASAFSIAELGELLPNRVTVPDAEPFDNFVITINKFYNVNEDRSLTNNYILNYSCDSTAAIGIDAWMCKKLTKNIFDPNLADAMAKMLIYLLENGLMK